MTAAMRRAKQIDVELGSTVASRALTYLRPCGVHGELFGRIHIALRGVGVRCVRQALDALAAANLVEHLGAHRWRVSQ